MEKKYLYCKSIMGCDVNRYEIARESDSNYWIKVRKNYQREISKKTMKTGSKWNHSYYYTETSELVTKYNLCRLQSIMKQIIAIELP